MTEDQTPADQTRAEGDPNTTDGGTTPEPRSPTQWSEPPPMGTESIPSAPPAKRGIGRAIFGSVVGRIIGIVIVFAVIGGGTAVWRALKHEKTLGDLGVGDCINVPDADRFETVKEVGCDSGHDGEVIAKLDDASTFDLGALDPNGGPSLSPAEEACVQAMLDYTGLTLDEVVESNLEVTYVEEAKAGISSRDVVCLAVSGDGTPLTGSVAAGA